MTRHSRILKGSALFIAFTLVFFCFWAILSSRGSYPSALSESAQQVIVDSVRYSDGAYYDGEILDGIKKHGYGRFTWHTGESYTGTWENDIMNGSGKMKWPGLGEYEGDFVKGKREGHGTFTWTYEGTPEDGAPLLFEGDWAADKIGKSGTLILNGIGTYEGEFSRQVRNGTGTFTWLNGDIYSGKWANDAITGAGVLTLADGTVLDGTFSKGTLTKGTITYAVIGGTAVRPVQGGKAQDSVSITYQDGTVVTGKLKSYEFAGNVNITYSTGDTYVGTLKSGLKDGKGTYTWKSGAHYVGEWKADKISGTGKYYYGKDESKLYLSGTFAEGVPSGTLDYVAENKLKYQTTWSNGSCTNIEYKKK